MLLKTRGYCPSSFLPRFQLNLISVTIALPARMPLSPVLVICAYFLFDCVAVLILSELTAPVSIFGLCRGWSGSCFSQLMQLLICFLCMKADFYSVPLGTVNIIFIMLELQALSAQ